MKLGNKRKPHLAVSNEGKFRRAVHSAVIAGIAVGAPAGIHAQETASPPPTAPQPTSEGATELDTLEVTGSRLPQPNLTSTSSYTVITDEELDFQGTINVEGLLNRMPQVFAEFSTGDSNGATGTATVNLRGLGSQRTLVMIDGKRLMPGDPRQSPPAPDINFIPAALVDSIEILSGGASAVYGSDAVAGVVNFKMKRDFEGFRIDTQGTITNHGDGITRNLSAVWGTNLARGSGNVTMYASYVNADAVIQGQRDFSQCAITTPASGDRHVCAGSFTIPGGRLFSYDRYSAGVGDYYALVNPDGTRSFVSDPFTETFNFAPLNHLQRPQERYLFGGFGHIELNDHLSVYADVMYMDDRTLAQIAPSGLFFERVDIPCDNPLLSASQVQYLCTDVGLDPALGDSADVLFAKRTVELGPRTDDLRHTDNRIVLGGRGSIVHEWNYDIFAQRGEVIFSEAFLNDLSTSRAQEALNGCPPGGTSGCVPLDLFQIGQITEDQADFVRGIGLAESQIVEEIAGGAVTGDLGRYGAKIPWASSALKIALGAEHRSEALDFRPDLTFQTGDLSGQGGETPPVSGRYNVDEAFAELQVPIVQGKAGASLLQFDGAYRRSDYSLAGTANTYKAGLQWAPVSDVTLRGSFQRAIRAPAVGELFLPQEFGLFGFSDPCAGATPSATLEQCQNTGVTPAQYGSIADCSSGQCNARFSGNAALKPEESDTVSFGIVFTPTFVEGLTVTLDYFDVSVEGAINTSPGIFLTQCLQTGDPTFCSFINRGPLGRIWGDTDGGDNFVEAPLFNLSVFQTTGLDLEANYRVGMADWGMPNAGRLAFHYATTYLDSYEQELGPGAGVFDCAGLYGVNCGTPKPHYRHKFRVTWGSPMGLDVSLNWRFIGATTLDTSTNDPNLTSTAGRNNTIDRELEEKSYLDLSGIYRVPFIVQPLAIRFGALNVLDEDPQVVSSNAPNPISSPPFGNANTFPNVYDSLGTVFFVGLQADF
jgi:iron complex outermembrane receptor protein